MWHIVFRALLASLLVAAAPSVAQMLHTIHEQAGMTCATCHTEDQPFDSTPTATCIACHGTMTGPVAAEEVAEGPDPHRSPHLGPDELPVCSECHSVHGRSEDTCSMCHRGFGFEMK